MFTGLSMRATGLLGLATLLGCASGNGPGAKVLDHTVKDIGGQEVKLSTYSGKVLLIVNVASKCGFTPQYAQLEAIYRKYQEAGLVILGFPSNDFLRQEPGTNEEIMLFCSSTYGVTFPMFAKISVRGKEAAPLYQDLTSKQRNGSFGGSIKWNFTKFLVARDGHVVARFGPKTKPDDPKVTAAIERALGETR